MRTGHIIWVLGLLALAQFSGLPASAVKQNLIELEITGDPGAAFAGDCRILTAGKLEKRYRIQGKTPAKYWLPAEAIRCSFEKSSLNLRLIGRISRGGVVELRQESPPPMRWLSMISIGPWGAAKGAASAARPLWQ